MQVLNFHMALISSSYAGMMATLIDQPLNQGFFSCGQVSQVDVLAKHHLLPKNKKPTANMQ